MSIPVGALALFLLADALLVVWRPRMALLLPLVVHAAYTLRSPVPLGSFTIPTTLLEGLLLLAVLGGVLRGPRQVFDALRRLPRSALACGALFLLAATVSAAIAPHPRTAWGQWKAFIVEPMLYAVVLLPALRSTSGRRAVMGALLLGGAVSAGLSLLAGAAALLCRGSDTPFCLLPSACCLASDFSRLSGIYDVPNSLALVLAPLVVFAAVLALSSEASTLRRRARWSLLLSVPTLLFTQSLGGIAAASGAIGALLIFRNSRNLLQYNTAVDARLRRRAGLGVLVAGAILLGLGLQLASGKLTHAFTATSPLQARLQIWEVSAALIADHPLLGTGLGTFEPAYQAKLRELLDHSSFGFRHSSFPLEWVVRDPHNILLSFWLNTGLLGLLSMSGLVLLAFRQWSRAVRISPASCLLPTASAGALAALLLFGLVDVPYFKNDLSVLWWGLLTVPLLL